MTKEVIAGYSTATNDFVKMLAAFNQQQFNTIPFEGSWTPAQVGDHILKSQWELPAMLSGETKPADRKPDENFGLIGSIFLDFSIKLKSPDFILPAETPQDKDEMIASFGHKSEEICQTFEQLDPTKICIDFQLPKSGPFTRLEWLYFVTCHTIRHTRQLENIHQQLIN